MTQPPAAPDTPHDPSHPPSPTHEGGTRHASERRVLVTVTIALASLLFCATAGLLYYRWATMREPMCIFIVEAPPTFRGAEVTVDGVSLPGPHTGVIGRGERFAIPFYLDYGTYDVRVTLNEATVTEAVIVLTRERPWQRIDLSPLPLPRGAPKSSASGPSTSPSSAPVWIPSETSDVPALTPPPRASRLSP
jgi:hypothetical protein